ncbi:hypothetical protein PKHYL_23620 [Psychrobacter sp. KH172YL61]|nr:hypothetical protein PKHYL_23620 [Psychrobacter sp. KH172YL61]
MLADDKELRFLTLPNNHDPDTFIKSHGSDAMREQISQAMPLSQYIFAYLSERYDMSLAEGKAKLMSQVRSLTTALPKGSSFRYLLNNDIYQKLGGRRSQNVEAKDALLDFDGDMTISQQLQLCFCFSRAHSLMTLSNRFGNSLVLMAYTYLRISNKGFSRYAASACLGRPARRGSA